MPTKRQILERIPKTDLLDYVAQYELDVADKRKTDLLVDALARSKKAKLPDMLEQLGRDQLKDLCRGLGLDDTGPAKARLIDTLLGGAGGNGASTSAPASTKPASAPASKPPASSPNGDNGGVRTFSSFSEITSFISAVADLLRGDYKQADYGKVILPFTVLRRLDCVLAPTKATVLARYEALKGGQLKNLDPVLNRITGVSFHNTSKLDFDKLRGEPHRLLVPRCWDTPRTLQ